MCRIWGISLGPKGWEGEGMTAPELAAQMFPPLVAGGRDAWGWASFDGQSITHHKYQGKANKRKATRRIAAQMDQQPQWVIGHTRAATHGKAEYHGNNHPIAYDKVIGVHNGVISNFGQILRAFGRWDDQAGVDSEAVFAALNSLGYHGLNLLEGSMVAVWSNFDDPDKVWIGRSKSSQLWCARTVNDSYVWCTERKPLEDCSLELQGKPEQLTSTGVVFTVERGKTSEMAVYDPTIKESTYGYGTHTTGWRSASSFKGSSSKATTSGPSLPTLSPGRNPAGTIRKLREAAKAQTDQEHVKVRQRSSGGAVRTPTTVSLDDVPISGITDYFDQANQGKVTTSTNGQASKGGKR